MRKILKWTTIVLLSPLVLSLVVAVLLYIPPIQNWAVRQAAFYASSQTGLDITVGRVSLVFPLDIGIERLRVLQQNDSLPQVKDTVADARSLVANIRMLPLFRGRVEVDRLDFRNVKLNTTNFIKSARVKGRVGRLALQSHGIDLGRKTVRVDNTSLSDADVDVALSDTVPKDTTKKAPNYWKIEVDGLNVANTGVTVHLPGDTLQISARIGRLDVRRGFFDLYRNAYTLARLDWTGGRLAYDNNFKTHSRGLDYNHISLSNVSLGIDSLDYSDPRLTLVLRKFAFREKSGLAVTDLSGRVKLDSASVVLPVLRLRTPESSLRAEVAMDFNTFAQKSPGHMDVFVDGSVGKQDIMRFLGGMPSGFVRRWPNYPLTLRGKVSGNMRHARMTGLVVKLPTAFSLRAGGYASSLMSPSRLRADMKVETSAYDINFLTPLFGSQGSRVRIPSGITFDGNLRASGSLYSAVFKAGEGGGHVGGRASFDASRMKYSADLTADNLRLDHFMPGQGFSPFTGKIVAEGEGFDFLSRRTRLQARAGVSKFSYGGYDLSGVGLSADVRNGNGHAVLKSSNRLLDGIVDVNALMSRKRLQTTVACDISHIDFYLLRLVKRPLSASLRANVALDSDLKKMHTVKGTIGNVAITDSDRIHRPEPISMDIFTRSDSTHASVRSGDFTLRLDAAAGYERILRDCRSLDEEMRKQFKDRYIDQLRLRKWLPYMTLYLKTGKDNIFCRSLAHFGYQIGEAFADLRSSSATGVNGHIDIDSLVVSGVRLDTIRLRLISDSARTDFTGKIRNSKKNPQYVFTALFGGTFYERGLYYGIQVKDAKERVGLALGLNAAMESNGIRLSIGGKQTPILGYKRFVANKDNYLFLGDDRRVSADLDLKAADGMGVQVYTNDSTEALQDLTVTLTKFDLAKVFSVIPYMPDVTGIMNGDFHVIKTADEMSVSSSVSVDNMTYGKSRMGNIATDFVYMPKGDGTHSVDGFLSCNGNEVGHINGTYDSTAKDGGSIDATLNLSRTPLLLLNGFIPDHIINFKGYCQGEMSVKGSLSAPDVNGVLRMDSAYIASAPYGMDLRFDDKEVKVENSHIMFYDFRMYAHNKRPLTMTGYFDFSRMQNMYLDLVLRADNYLLVDSRENHRSEAYGKAYVNFYSSLRGPLENLTMRGKLDVLGSTDMTYILRDSPLSTGNQLEGLVKFVDFKDSVEHKMTRPAIEGFTMDLTMNIDEGAHVVCALNPDHSNYVDLIGGGNLRMQYNAVDNLRLSGRYTLNNGEMKYSLPVIPLKTFTIQDGSYIEFNGDPMNPRLNITATEQTKATVSSEGEGSGRSVLFTCGVVITKTLKDMGLQFTIDAPEDQTISSELQTMSAENRGKIAVTMLTTGMYLSGGSDMKDFSMNNALSAFLNSQINSISGSALRTLDLSFEMENTAIGGDIHTDYSFKFAKRFWNNRLSIVVGGKVSSGAEVENQNNTFFDNVTFEYRLSDTSNKYLRLFYERDSYDWLEGDIGKYGGGFLWRHKLQSLGDIFRFKRSKQPSFVLPTAGNDTLKSGKNEKNGK